MVVAFGISHLFNARQHEARPQGRVVEDLGSRDTRRRNARVRLGRGLLQQAHEGTQLILIPFQNLSRYFSSRLKTSLYPFGDYPHSESAILQTRFISTTFAEEGFAQKLLNREPIRPGTRSAWLIWCHFV